MKECVLYPAASIVGTHPSEHHTSGFVGPVPSPAPPSPPPGPAPGTSFDQKLVVLSEDEATDYGAKCLDGSPPAIYYAPARGGAAYQDKWVLYFKGGGWCFDEESCAARSRTVLGSTTKLYVLICAGTRLHLDFERAWHLRC